MNPDLIFEYTHDWRLHSLVFRLGGGANQLAREGWKYQGTQLFWIALLVYTIYVADLADEPPLLCLALGALIWRISYAYSLLGLARRAAYGVRASFRAHPVKKLRLVVTESGLHDYDSGVESYAPWSSVKSFGVLHGTVIITLENGFAAYVPRATLSPSSSSIDELVHALRSRSIPEQSLQSPRLTNAG